MLFLSAYINITLITSPIMSQFWLGGRPSRVRSLPCTIQAVQKAESAQTGLRPKKTGKLFSRFLIHFQSQIHSSIFVKSSANSDGAPPFVWLRFLQITVSVRSFARSLVC